MERNLCLSLRLIAVTNDPLEGGMCQVCVEIHIAANSIRNVSFYVITFEHEETNVSDMPRNTLSCRAHFT